MDVFTEIEDALAIVTIKGVAYQRKLYRRGDALYVAHGAGFVRMCNNGATFLPRLRWQEHNVDAKKLGADVHGRLTASRDA